MNAGIAGAAWVLPLTFALLALGAALILAGVAAASEGGFALAALFAMLVLLATAPLAAHAMARSAHRAGIAPLTGTLGDALAEAEALTEADPGAAPPEHGAPAPACAPSPLRRSVRPRAGSATGRAGGRRA